MYKILYLTQFSEIGGGETILLSLLEKLDRKIFKPYVVVPKSGQLSRRLKQLGIKTYLLDLPPYLIRTFFVPGASPHLMNRFIRLTKTIQPDLIHANHLTLAIYGGLAGKLLKIPVVATAHGPWDAIYFYQDLVTNLFVNKIIVPTAEIKKLILRRKIIRTQKVTVIQFGIDTNKFKPTTKYQQLVARKAFGFSSTDFVITIVGRLDPSKDHLTFLKTAQIVAKKLKNTRFFIVGSKLGDFSGQKYSYMKRIKNFLNDNPKLARRITFGGFIEDMPAVYSATDILVSSSPSESFGLAIAEAASCALPIVATDVGNIRAIIKNGKSGFLVSPKNPQAIARRIQTLFKNPVLGVSLGKFARGYVQKDLPLENYIAKVESQYRQLILRAKRTK